MALFLQYPLELVLFCSSQISNVFPFLVHLRSLQAATNVFSLLTLCFLEDSPLSIHIQIRMVCMGSSGVVRITRNTSVTRITALWRGGGPEEPEGRRNHSFWRKWIGDRKNPTTRYCVSSPRSYRLARWSSAWPKLVRRCHLTVVNRAHCLAAHVHSWECDNDKKSVAYNSWSCR